MVAFKTDIKEYASKKTSIQYKQHDPSSTMLFLKDSILWTITSEKCFFIIMHAGISVGITLNKWRPLGEANVKRKNCWVTGVNNKATSYLLAVVRLYILYRKIAHINEFLKLNTVQTSCKAWEKAGNTWATVKHLEPGITVNQNFFPAIRKAKFSSLKYFIWKQVMCKELILTDIRMQ